MLPDLIPGACRIRNSDVEWLDEEFPCLWHPSDTDQLFPIREIELVAELEDDVEMRTTVYNVSHRPTGAALVGSRLLLETAVETVEKLLAATAADDKLHQIFLLGDHQALISGLGKERRGKIQTIVNEAAA